MKFKTFNVISKGLLKQAGILHLSTVLVKIVI